MLLDSLLFAIHFSDSSLWISFFTISISKEQLIEVYNALRHELPHLLDKNLDYSMFSEKVVFVNNWQGHATTSVGLKPLIYRMALLRAICNLLFVRSEMQV